MQLSGIRHIGFHCETYNYPISMCIYCYSSSNWIMWQLSGCVMWELILFKAEQNAKFYKKYTIVISPSIYNVTVWMDSWLSLRGFVKLKKNQKIREKLGLATPHAPTPISIFLIFFGNMYNRNKQQNTHKNTTFQKKKKSFRVGAWPTHPLSSFSRIFWFFLTWQNP